MLEEIVRRGTLTTVAALIVCVVGIAAAFRIPVQMIPDLDVRTITVTTTWPGGTPQDMEKDILIEQEEYLRGIPGLNRLVSRASTGLAQIELEFPYDVDLTQTLIRVNNALNQVPEYPENVDQPTVEAASFSQNSFMYFAISPLDGNPRGLDMDMMRDFIDDHVRRRIETVPGISLVELNGGAERQIQIMLDPAALAQRNISISDIRTAIRARNRDVSGGELESGSRRYLLRTIGRFKDLAAIESLIIRREANAIIRLGDVAEVHLGHFELDEHVLLNGKPVIALWLHRQVGSNVIDIKYAVLKEVETINREVLKPAGMKATLTGEDAGYVEDSISNIWTNLVLGAALVTLVMYVFLRSWRATLIGVIGIPICAIAAFIGLLIAGRTINVISLAGVAFAIGMTIDNSVVVLESIDLRLKAGLDRFHAAVEGMRLVWPAVVASTLTTILVFVPVAFIHEEAGQLYSDIAIAVSGSILASMLVATTIVPTAVANIGLGDADVGRDTGIAARITASVMRRINYLLEGKKRQRNTIGVTLGLSAFIFFVLTPSASYLPEGEEPKSFIFMNAPPGYSASAMAEIGRELGESLRRHVGEDPRRFERGEADTPALEYLLMWISPERIFFVAEPTRHNQIDDMMDAITAKIRTYPGMTAFATRGSIISSNQGGTRSINLDVSGSDLTDVYAAALAVYERAGHVFENPSIQATPSTLSLSQPYMEIRPNWDHAEELGFDAASLGYAVAALGDGAYVDDFFQEDDKIDIYLYSSAGQNADPDTLAQLPLHTPAGGTVTLGSVAEIAETVNTSIIRRIDGRRTVTIGIIPPKDVALATGIEEVKANLVRPLHEMGQSAGGRFHCHFRGRRSVGSYRGRNRCQLYRCGHHRILAACSHFHPLDLPASHNGDDSSWRCLRNYWAAVAQSRRRHITCPRFPRILSAVRYDLDVGIPDPHGNGRKQPHSGGSSGDGESTTGDPNNTGCRQGRD